MSEQISGLQLPSAHLPFEPFSALKPREVFEIADTLVKVHYDAYLTASRLTQGVVHGIDDTLQAYSDFLVAINPELKNKLSEEEHERRLAAAARTLNLTDGESYSSSLSHRITYITQHTDRAEPAEPVFLRLKDGWDKTEEALLKLDTAYTEWRSGAETPVLEDRCRNAFAEFLNAGQALMKSAKDIMRQAGRPLELHEQAERISGIGAANRVVTAGNNAG